MRQKIYDFLTFCDKVWPESFKFGQNDTPHAPFLPPLFKRQSVILRSDELRIVKESNYQREREGSDANKRSNSERIYFKLRFAQRAFNM